MLLALIVIVVLVALAVVAIRIAPRLLDRVYYSGPPSDHFDGERFFNPDDRRIATDSAPGRGPPPLRMLRFLLGIGHARWPRSVPVDQTIPSRRVDGDALRVTWIGHSTVLVQSAGLNILTDPVWSDRTSPVRFLGPRRVRAPGVAFDALPPIDLVLLSHSHYDHLDIATLRRLWDRDRPRIVAPLGTDAILRDHGIASEAHDWNDRVAIAPGIDVVLKRVHHWTSRRGADRNRALWTGFAVTLPGGDVFFAGDTGLGDGRWVDEAAADGPYRLALIPIGAYVPRELMAGAHIGPAEAATIFRDLDARYGVAVHWGTIQLSAEPFDDPPLRLAERLAADGIAGDRFRAIEPGVAWDVP